MVDQGVITQVTEPTDWVSSIVLVKEPNTDKLRTCLDSSNLNKAIKRPRFPLPTIEEVIPNLKKAGIFSLLDGSSGFWQVELDK